ncbi:hypothetical protein ABDK00_004585 [Niabella insulamsoli]|uniref:hypothetical protein n=1 Tax=Niabella insulamsoli TaxID=3144874 RepID=UPI0031FD916E
MANTLHTNPLFSCQKATELLDKQSVLKLSLREKMLMTFHVAICKACRRYKKQSLVIDNILKSHSQKSGSGQVPEHMNEELKDKICELLKKNK